MIFHYKRDSGEQGKLHRQKGSGNGVELSQFIQDNTLPIRLSLEILSYVADALNEAHKSQEVHGHLRLHNVLLTPEGSVVVNGFGKQQHNAIIPEKRAVGPATDVYCLGVMLLALLSQDELFSPPTTQENHAVSIVERMLHVDWQELQEQQWLANVREFLISTMAFNPVDRPSALDVANVLSNIIPLTRPHSLENLLKDYQHLFEHTETEDTEELEGAISMEQQLYSSQHHTPVIPDSSQGAATGLWPREKILEMLQKEPEEEQHREEWQPIQVSNPQIAQNAYEAPPDIPDVTENSIQSIPSISVSAPPIPEPRQPPTPKITQRKPPKTPPPKTPPSGPSHSALVKYIVLIAGASLFIFSLTVGVVYYMLSKDADNVTIQEIQTPPAEELEANQEDETDTEKTPTEPEEKEAETAEKPPPPKLSAKEREKRRLAREKRKQERERRKKEALEKQRQEAAKNAQETTQNAAMKRKESFQVKIRLAGLSGRISCGDGQSKEFTGTAYFKFRSQQSCAVKTDDGLRGGFTVSKEGSVSCKPAGSGLSCR